MIFDSLIVSKSHTMVRLSCAPLEVVAMRAESRSRNPQMDRVTTKIVTSTAAAVKLGILNNPDTPVELPAPRPRRVVGAGGSDAHR
jgi:hypothetical protein